jgi:dTDP-4-dehydrorhamnose reductase
MTSLLILGAQGQVGRAVAKQARRSGVKHEALGRAECDVTDRPAVEYAVGRNSVVVNCAAYTAVDRAEAEPAAAHRINAVGAGTVAAACAAAGVPLVHLSTDYVFSGESDRPVREDDPPRPLSVYGQSKLDGEIAVRHALERHIILRTSWVFSAHGENFVKTILRLASTQAELRIVDDQIGGPTAADDIAAAALRIVDVAARSGFAGWGTYHFSGAPPVSWCAFARAIAPLSVAVRPIATSDNPRPARRPRNSVLDCRRVRDVFGIAQPDWHLALHQVLEVLDAQAQPRGRS